MITTASAVIPFVFASISSLSIFTAGIDSVEFLGNFSVAPSSNFSIHAGCQVNFWRALEFGAFSQSFLDRIVINGFLLADSGAELRFNRSAVIGELHFLVRPTALPANVYVEPGCDFTPAALYIDIEGTVWAAGHNASMPLIRGHFDCEYVRSRARFAMIDTNNGFYMFRGSCEPDRDGVQFVLAAIFTPYTAPGLDSRTELMMITFAGVVGMLLIVSMISCCYLRRRRRFHQEAEELTTYGI
jgi:hypothetical protein